MDIGKLRRLRNRLQFVLTDPDNTLCDESRYELALALRMVRDEIARIEAVVPSLAERKPSKVA